MKTTCIVMRNINSSLGVIDYEEIVDTLMKGGFPVSKVFILPFDAVSVLCETIATERQDADNIVFIADSVLIHSLKNVVGKFLDLEFSSDYSLVAPECNYFVCPAGENGVELARGQILPYLTRRYGQVGGKIVVRMVGAPMKKIQSVVTDASDLSRNTLGFNLNEKYGDISLEVIYDSDTPVILIESVKRIVRDGLGDYIYSLDDEPLERCLYNALKMRRLKLCVSESFTGGGVAARMVSVPGVSEVYLEGLNTYANSAKMQRLGVKKDTLERYGAVSDQTAYEMAMGSLAVEGCDVAISTTGLAGPDSDEFGNPVGLCYVGIGTKEQIYVYKFNIAGGRKKITQTAINYALFQALRIVESK